MTESIIINEEEYNIEDEELDEVSYYEILSLNEIIKDNPTFIAYSREEIINELNNIFKDSVKSNALSELFFKNNKKDVSNIVFIADVEKTIHEEINEEGVTYIEEYVNSLNKMNRLQYNIGNKQKDKFYFALKYDTESQLLRFKPEMKTLVNVKNSDSPSYFYLVLKDDEVNLPIQAAYFKEPIATVYDKLSDQVLSHTKGKPHLYNYVNSDIFTNIDKFIDSVKPKMKLILEKIEIDKDDYNFDHTNIDNILRKYDNSLDEIKQESFELLQEKFKEFLDITPIKILHKKASVRSSITTNEKLFFYDKLRDIIQLINIPEKVKDENELTIASLEEQKFELNASPLIYNNMNDIINAVNNNDMSLEDIVHNIDVNRKVIVIDHAITTLKHLNKNDVADIDEKLTNLKSKFEKLKEIKKDLFELHFLNFYKETKELREANDYSDYEGIPDVFKNEAKYEEQGYGNVDMDMIEIDNSGFSTEGISRMKLEKYWISTKYKNAKGFTEMLQIVLPILNKIKDVSKLPLDFDHVSNELYNHFAGISTKYNILQNIFKKHEINESDEYIRNISKLSPRVAFMSTFVSEYEQFKDIVMYIKECNEEFVKTLTKMINMSIAWWSIQIQEDVIYGINIVDENIFDPVYVDKWSLDGLPMKESHTGVLVYLSAITQDIVSQEVEYFTSQSQSDMKDVLKSVKKVISDKYEDIAKNLIDQNKEIIKKSNKGSETYKALINTFKERNRDKLLGDYINALLYMPGYKYKKINKFLLGCCLQKIGKDFVAFDDLSERKDLIKAKENYSKKRNTVNKSREMYYPVVSENKKIKKQDIKYILPTIKMNDVKLSTVKEWVENMKQVSPLFPEKIITLYQNDPRHLKTLSEKNIEIFCKTAGMKSKTNEIKMNFEKTRISYGSLLIRICTVLKMTNIDTSEEESRLLTLGIQSINSIIEDIDKLYEIVDEYNINNVQYITEYILTRALCLPFNPDIASENNDILFSSIPTSENFVKNTTKNMFNLISKYMNYSIMPTIEENMNFINKLREENKRKTLDKMNIKTNEERSLIDELKKYGMREEVEYMMEGDPEEYVEDFELNTMYNKTLNNNEMNDNDGEEEFLMIGEEEDEFEFD